MPPLVEYDDVHRRSLSTDQEGRAVRFIEAGTGAMVSLRADVTPQIARMVAQRIRPEGRAVRVSYAADVLRIPDERRERAELHQVGVELIGEDGALIDAELVALADACLRGAGLDDFRVEIAHTGVFRAALRTLGLSAADAARLRGPFARKDEVGVSSLLKAHGVGPKRRAAMFALCRAYGGVDELTRARVALQPLKVSNALDHLERVVELLGTFEPSLPQRLVIDLGEARGFDYYTGIRLRAWARGTSEPVIRGGRYDDMVARYGAELPAIGFAVDLDALERVQGLRDASNAHRVPTGCVIVVSDPEKGNRMTRAIKLARDLREEGTSVWVSAQGRDLMGAKQLAFEQGAQALIHVGARTTAWALDDETWCRQDGDGKRRKK